MTPQEIISKVKELVSNGMTVKQAEVIKAKARFATQITAGSVGNLVQAAEQIQRQEEYNRGFQEAFNQIFGMLSPIEKM